MPVWENKGRPRFLHAMDCMAPLALAWTRTRGSTMILLIGCVGYDIHSAVALHTFQDSKHSVEPGS